MRKAGFINKRGEMVLETEYDNVCDFREGLALAAIVSGCPALAIFLHFAGFSRGRRQAVRVHLTESRGGNRYPVRS